MSHQENKSFGKRTANNFRLNKELVSAATVDSVLEIAYAHIGSMNVVNIGTTFYRLALVALNSGQPGRKDSSQPGSPSSSRQLTPAARYKLFDDERLLAIVDAVIKAIESDLSPKVEQAASAVSPSVLATGTRHQTPGSSLAFPPKELSNIVWACTKLGLCHEALFSALSRHVTKYVDLYDSVNLSLTLWGFAKLDFVFPEMFAATKTRVLEVLDDFEPHRLCNTVWAYAKTGNRDAELFEKIAVAAFRKLSKFNASNESMLFYSFALARVHVPILFDRILSNQVRGMTDGGIVDPRSISNLVWSVSELALGSTHGSVFTAAAGSAIANIHRYSLTHLSTLLSGFEKANQYDPALLVAVSKELTRRNLEDSLDPSSRTDLEMIKTSIAHLTQLDGTDQAKSAEPGKSAEQGRPSVAPIAQAGAPSDRADSTACTNSRSSSPGIPEATSSDAHPESAAGNGVSTVSEKPSKPTTTTAGSDAQCQNSETSKQMVEQSTRQASVLIGRVLKRLEIEDTEKLRTEQQARFKRLSREVISTALLATGIMVTLSLGRYLFSNFFASREIQ